MITLSQLAKLAHVSVSTVSKAFSMSEEVNEQTREEVFRIAKEYGCFKKYYKAKYPKTVIAVICPELGEMSAAKSASWNSQNMSCSAAARPPRAASEDSGPR